MAKHKDELDNFRKFSKPVKNQLTEFQLQEMEKEIEKYMEEKHVTFPNPMKIKIFNEKKWLIDKGGLNKNGAIKIYNYKPGKYDARGNLIEPCDCEPILWEQLQEDLRQYWFWKGKKGFVEQKKFEGLQELANTMTLPKDW